MRPFEGLKIIDTTHVIAGPFATYQLAVLGADVIKVDRPDDPDQSRLVGHEKALNSEGMGTQFLTQASNKRSITLDLKTEKGRAILKRLASKADVFVENYRPGSFEALGLGYEALATLNPKLIYCSISAFGQTGPLANQTAFDNVIQATSGLMAQTGTPEVNPVKIGTPVVDFMTGVMGAFALASALFQRERTGKGQHIDLGMLDAALMLSAHGMVSYLRTGVGPKPQGNDHTHFATSSCYQTKDGMLMVGATNLRQQRRLWEALERPDMVKEDNLQRSAGRAEESALLKEILATRTAAEWEAFFRKHSVPAARVRTMMETLDDPHFAARETVHRHEDFYGAPLTVPMTGFKFAHGGPSIETPPPRMGEHNEELLEELGYSTAEIAGFRAEKVI